MANTKIRNCFFLFLFSFVAGCANTEVTDVDKSGEDTFQYKMVKGWLQLPEGLVLSQVTGIGIDSSQNILLFHRAGRKWTEPFPDTLISLNTVLTIDHKSGNIIDTWGGNHFIMPHGLTVDRENNVWVTDVGLQQVFKFSHEGKLLLMLGTAKEAGNDRLHFNLPTDVAVANDGSFYVSDGYGNSRVVKFSKEGKYLFEWGSKGSKPGQFNIPHGIDLDARGNVYVADRENNRIQKFDANGRFVSLWKNNEADQLYSLAVSKTNNKVFAIDYLTFLSFVVKGSDILRLDSTLKLVTRFGRTGSYDGPTCRYHDIAIDNEESIYVGDILDNRIQKFSKVSSK